MGCLDSVVLKLSSFRMVYYRSRIQQEWQTVNEKDKAWSLDQYTIRKEDTFKTTESKHPINLSRGHYIDRWQPNSSIIKVKRECNRTEQKIEHIPHATTLWPPLPTMINQSQNFIPPISFIPLEQMIRFHPKNNPPFSDSSQRIQ